jgi:hypothetical protein
MMERLILSAMVLVLEIECENLILMSTVLNYAANIGLIPPNEKQKKVFKNRFFFTRFDHWG